MRCCNKLILHTYIYIYVSMFGIFSIVIWHDLTRTWDESLKDLDGPVQQLALLKPVHVTGIWFWPLLEEKINSLQRRIDDLVRPEHSRVHPACSIGRLVCSCWILEGGNLLPFLKSLIGNPWSFWRNILILFFLGKSNMNKRLVSGRVYIYISIYICGYDRNSLTPSVSGSG